MECLQPLILSWSIPGGNDSDSLGGGGPLYGRATPFEPTKAMDPALPGIHLWNNQGIQGGCCMLTELCSGRCLPAVTGFILRVSDRILHSGKFNWTYVLGTALMDPIFTGGKTVIVYEGNPHAELWPKLIVRHQCTFLLRSHAV